MVESAAKRLHVRCSHCCLALLQRAPDRDGHVYAVTLRTLRVYNLTTSGRKEDTCNRQTCTRYDARHWHHLHNTATASVSDLPSQLPSTEMQPAFARPAADMSHSEPERAGRRAAATNGAHPKESRVMCSRRAPCPPARSGGTGTSTSCRSGLPSRCPLSLGTSRGTRSRPRDNRTPHSRSRHSPAGKHR